MRCRARPEQGIDSSRLSFEFKKSIGFNDDTVLNCKRTRVFPARVFPARIRFDKESCDETDQETDHQRRLSRERGAADAERDIRGFADKLYTEEGNWDNW